MKKLTQGATRLLVLALGLGLATTGWAATAPSITVDGANVTVHNDNGTEWDNAGITAMSGYQNTTFTIPSGTGLSSGAKVLVSTISIGASSSQPGNLPAKLSLTVGDTTYVSKTATVTAGGFSSSGRNKHTYSFDGKYCILTVGTAAGLKWINEDGSELQGAAAFGLVKQGHQFISRIAWSGSVPVTEITGKIVTIATGAQTDINNTATTPKCLQNVTGWLSTSTASTGEIILLNGANGYGLCLNNANSLGSNNKNSVSVWNKLSGNGNLTTTDNNWQTPAVKIYDAREFTGSINASGGNVRLAVIFCASADTFSPSVYEEIGSKSGLIYIKPGTSVTVAEGATWTAVNGIVNKGSLMINGTVASEISNSGGTVTVNAGATVPPFGSQRDFTGFTIDSSVQVKIKMTTEEYGKGSVSVTGASGISSITVLAPDGTTEVTTLTPENGEAAYDRGTVLVSGKACWCDYEMDYVSGKTGFENTGTDTTGLSGDGVTGDSAFYNGMLYTYAHPWRNIAYPSDGNWTAVVRCTVPAYENAAVITFGTKDGGLIGLVAGANPETQMRLVQTTGNSHFVTNATMTVQNATTAQHVYIFSVENNQTVKVYCDGDQVLNKTFDSQFTIGGGIQVGSVHGGIGNTGIIRFAKNESPAKDLSETVQKDARIDCVRLYDYSLSAEQIAALSVEFPAVKLYRATVAANATTDWNSLTWSPSWDGGNSSSKIILTVEGDASLTLPDSITANEFVMNVPASNVLTLSKASGGTTLSVTEPIEVAGGTIYFNPGISQPIGLGDLSFGGTGTVRLGNGTLVNNSISGSASVELLSGVSAIMYGGSIANPLKGAGLLDYMYGNSLPSGLSFGDWTGTVKLPGFTADALNLNNYGKAGSVVEITAVNGGWIVEAGKTIAPTLKLSGNMTINAMSSWTYTFAEITGSGNLSFSTSANSPTVNITKVAEGYSGTISSTLGNPVTIATLDRAADATVTPGSKVLSTSSGVQASALTVGGEATGIVPVFDTDGLYVKAASVTKNNATTYHNTVADALTAAGSDAATITLLAPTDNAITLAPGQTLVNGNLTTGNVTGPNGYEVVNNNGTYTLVDNTASTWSPGENSDNNWSTAANWSTGYLPSQYTVVTFPESESAHVVKLTLNNANSEAERHRCASMVLNGDVTFQRANSGTWAYVFVYGNVTGTGTLTFERTGLNTPGNSSIAISCPVVGNAASNDNFFSGSGATYTFSAAVDIAAGEFKADYANLVFNGPVTIRNGYVKSNGEGASATFNGGINVPAGASASLTVNGGSQHTIASTVTLGAGATFTIPTATTVSGATFTAASGYDVVHSTSGDNTVYTTELKGATVSNVAVSYGADYASATVTATVSDTTLDYYISWAGGEPVKGSVSGSGSQVTFDVSGINHTTEYQSAAYSITAKDGETDVTTTGGSGTTVAADTTTWFSQSSANSGAPVNGSWTTAVNLTEPATVEDNTFTAAAESTSSRVVLEFNVCFSATNADDVSGEAQAAIKLGESGGATTFMVLASNAAWTPVSRGDFVPDASATYKVVMTIDYGNGSYGVTVGDNVLTNASGSANFPLAKSGATSVKNIDFAGSGTLTSMKGDQVEGYMVVANNGTRYPTIAAAIAAYNADPTIGQLRVLHAGTPPSGWSIVSQGGIDILKKLAKGFFFMAY